MARIKISMPEQFSFSTNIPVRISDINYGGHVGNDSLLSIIHEARLQFLKHHGYTEMDVEGNGIIMADASVEFKQEAFYADVIKVSVTASEFSRVGFDLFYKLEKEMSNEIIIIAIAKTGMVCFDYSLKKIAPLPESVIKKLQQQKP